jgi:hypothetical protein
LPVSALSALLPVGEGKNKLRPLIENLDTLESLRGSERMLADMIDRPEWVEAKLAEINQVWFEAARRMFPRVKGGAHKAGRESMIEALTQPIVKTELQITRKDDPC